tara:strand:+ start:1273 stop:1398 length:126 start_codon:yes stop_codon:yes gene_type:complete
MTSEKDDKKDKAYYHLPPLIIAAAPMRLSSPDIARHRLQSS